MHASAHTHVDELVVQNSIRSEGIHTWTAGSESPVESLAQNIQAGPGARVMNGTQTKSRHTSARANARFATHNTLPALPKTQLGMRNCQAVECSARSLSRTARATTITQRASGALK